MSTKYTPGPWTVKRYREIWPESASAGFVIVRERPSIEWKGATMKSYTHVALIPDNPRGQVAGNALMVASAPELFAALAWALGRLKLDQSSFVGSKPYQSAVELLNSICEPVVPSNIPLKATGGVK